MQEESCDMTESVSRRPLRADAARNRDRLLDAAKSAFADKGREVSLEEIARRAEVGIGTLYRHFPNRDAVMEALYEREIKQVAIAAETLLKQHPPYEAMGRWLRLCADHIAENRLVVPVYMTHSGGKAGVYGDKGLRFLDAMRLLGIAARNAGAIRDDISPGDLVQMMLGLSQGTDQPRWKERTLRLIDVFMDGLKPKLAA